MTNSGSDGLVGPEINNKALLFSHNDVYFPVCLQVVKLHLKLGKPIPSDDPVVVGAKTATASSAPNAANPTTPGGKLPSPVQPGGKKDATPTVEAKDDLLDLKEKEVEPVGQEYIEEIKGGEGDPAG